jgi:hypothetical protein
MLALLLLTLMLVITACGSSSSSTTTSQPTTTIAPTATTQAGTGGVPTQPIVIQVPLTGQAVVPAVQTSASGSFTLNVEVSSSGSTGAAGSTTQSSTAGSQASGYAVAYKLDVSNIQDVTGAAIHQGGPQENGPVVYTLFSGSKSGSFTGTLAEGSLTANNLEGPLKGQSFESLVGTVLAGQIYIEVTTTAHPNGELRGQLTLQGIGPSAGSTTGSS